MKKLFLIFLLGLLLISSCTLRHIPDTNGDTDYSLNTLTDEDFVKGYSALTQQAVTKKTSTTIKVNVKKMSGISNLKTLEPKGKTINIKTNLTLNSGNIRLVLMKGKEIIYDFKVNGEDIYKISLSEDKYNIRLGAESANFNLEITLS